MGEALEISTSGQNFSNHPPRRSGYPDYVYDELDHTHLADAEQSEKWPAWQRAWFIILTCAGFWAAAYFMLIRFF